jgi:hypothetical protein
MMTGRILSTIFDLGTMLMKSITIVSGKGLAISYNTKFEHRLKIRTAGQRHATPSLGAFAVLANASRRLTNDVLIKMG